jgi:multidrug resistance efflux pump
MSRLFDAIQKSQGQLGEIGRSLVGGTSSSSIGDDGMLLQPETDVVPAAPDELTIPGTEIRPPVARTEQAGPLVEVETPVIPNRRRRRPVLALLGLAVLVAAGYGFWRTSGGQNILPWLSAGPSAAAEMRFSGVVVAQETAVAAKIAGRIERLLVDEGSLVHQGDIIAVLDKQETDADRDNQQAKVDQLNSRLLQSQEMLRLESERNEHQLQRAAAQVKAAESELRTAQVELEQSRKDLVRRQDLHRDGVIASSELERYQMAVEVNQARLKSLQERVQASQAELELMRSNLRQVAVAASDVDQTRAQLVQAQALRQQADVRLQYSTIRAPMSGLVSVRVARQGEIVTPGSPIVTLVDLDDIWVKADVEETWINRISIGSRLPVQLASGERTSGEVFFVSPEADFATQRDINRVKRDVRTFGIKIRLANDSRRIHPGMTAYVMLPNSPAAERQ